MSMYCRMHLDMAWLHLFSLEIAHPTIPRDVSTTATSMSSPDSGSLLKIQSQYVDLFLECLDGSFSRVCLTQEEAPSTLRHRPKSWVLHHNAIEHDACRIAEGSVYRPQSGNL